MAAATFATQFGQFIGTPTNNDTITVGSVVYRLRVTGQSLVQANDVRVGAALSLRQMCLNMAAAINADPTQAGIAFNASTLVNPEVFGFVRAGQSQLMVQGRIPGQLYNRVPLSKTGTQFAWGAGTLANGTGDYAVDLARYIREYQCPASVEELFRSLVFGETSP